MLPVTPGVVDLLGHSGLGLVADGAFTDLLALFGASSFLGHSPVAPDVGFLFLDRTAGGAFTPVAVLVVLPLAPNVLITEDVHAQRHALRNAGGIQGVAPLGHIGVLLCRSRQGVTSAFTTELTHGLVGVAGDVQLLQSLAGCAQVNVEHTLQLSGIADVPSTNAGGHLLEGNIAAHHFQGREHFLNGHGVKDFPQLRAVADTGHQVRSLVRIAVGQDHSQDGLVILVHIGLDTL